MIATRLLDLANWTRGALLSGVPSDLVTSLSTDSRTLAGGELFLALKGDQFNGHDFLKKAIEAGAAHLLVSELPEITESFPGGVIHVRNTERALQEIALRYRRHQIPDCFAIGVTGSNGKTSTKEFLRAVLSQKGRVNGTTGNLNNHIGLPLTVLGTEAEDRFGVWEMGMNHPGEIGPLAEIARPDAAVVTNVGTAHIEHMKTREAIADEKSRLARAVRSGGFCVMPETDDFFEYMKSVVSCEVIGVGGESSLVRAGNVRIGEKGAVFDLIIDGNREELTLPVTGRHMVSNALLAAATGFRCGLSLSEIVEGLRITEMPAGRLEKLDWNGITILNDSYNANPDSVKAAISCLMESPGGGKKIAVLGFMGELGDHEETAHREVGQFAAESGVDLIVTVSGKAALIADGAGNRAETVSFEHHEQAAEHLRSLLVEGDTVLVKGSRAAGMEKVIEILTN